MMDGIISHGNKIEMDGHLAGAAIIHYRENGAAYDTIFAREPFEHMTMAAYISLLIKRSAYELKEDIDSLVE